jgi:hypothetical protein
MYRRRSTNGLDTKRVKELTHGWQHAARIGCPLNVMITIRPFEDQDPATHCAVAAMIRNKLGVYARQHGFPFVAAWSRESNEDGDGEHLHILMHVPAKHYADLTATVIRWFPEPGAADVQRANQNVRLTADGKQMSAIGYIAKQMTSQAWYKRGLIRKRGGPVLGKRGGVTRNIGAAAIDQYFDSLRAAQGEFPGQNDGVGAARARTLEADSSPTWDLKQEDHLGIFAEPSGTAPSATAIANAGEIAEESPGLTDASRGFARARQRSRTPGEGSRVFPGRAAQSANRRPEVISDAIGYPPNSRRR